MKKTMLGFFLLLMMVGGAIKVGAEPDSALSGKSIGITVTLTADQQAQIDKELALKAAAMQEDVNQPQGLNPYFIETAKKLGVDIEGLSDDEIMIKVKAAEVQYAIDHPVILTEAQQAEIDRLTAEKDALASH